MSATWEPEVVEPPADTLTVLLGKNHHADGGPPLMQRLEVIVERYPGQWVRLYDAVSVVAARAAVSAVQRGHAPGGANSARALEFPGRFDGRYSDKPNDAGRFTVYVRYTP